MNYVSLALATAMVGTSAPMVPEQHVESSESTVKTDEHRLEHEEVAEEVVPNDEPVDSNRQAVDESEEPRITYEAFRTNDRPEIDGFLDDWDVASFEPLDVQLGEGDVRETSFQVMYDDQFLYVAVQTEEESYVVDGEGHWFEQDHISLFLHPASTFMNTFEGSDVQLGFVYAPNTTEPTFHFGAMNNHSEKEESEVKRAIRTTDRGWTLEVAIPWSFLQLDVPPETLGMNVSKTHRDEEGHQPLTVWSSYEGGASFWDRTAAYGVVQLMDQTGEVEPAAKTFHVTIDETVERGMTDVPYNLYATYHGGIRADVLREEVTVHSSDDGVVRVGTDQALEALGEGKATLTFTYGEEVVTKDVHVQPADDTVPLKAIEAVQPHHFVPSVRPFDVSTFDVKGVRTDGKRVDVSADAIDWTIVSGEATIEGTRVIPKGEGPILVEGSIGDVNERWYVFVKEETSETYTLYEETFDTLSDETFRQTYETFGKGNVYVENGALHIDGRVDNYGMTGVMLPSYLQTFGNYAIDARLTHREANDTGRWHSILFRAQHPTHSYYQMAVRQNTLAGNGVEFAHRTPDAKWNVEEKGAWQRVIEPDQWYDYSVRAYGPRVIQSINGETVLNHDRATEYDEGGIGFQAAGSLTVVDAVKVTLLESDLPPLPERPGENFVDVAPLDTSIALAPTIDETIETKQQLHDAWHDPKGANVTVYVNEALELTNRKGDVIGTLAEWLSERRPVIPNWIVERPEVIEPLVEQLRLHNIEDTAIVSDRADVLKRAHEAYPIMRGVYDVSDRTLRNPNDWMRVRKEANGAGAKTVVLNESSATREAVRYLQQKLLTVAVRTDRAPTLTSIHRSLTSGVNRIVTTEPTLVRQAIESYGGDVPTLLKTPFIIGHRGMPGKAPENTVEGSLLAYEAGANMIENDIYLTKDGELIVMHDRDIQRTTNGKGDVESFTLEELRQFEANAQYPESFPNVRIPTLADYFEAFRGKDTDVFVEIKSAQPEIVDRLIEEIETYRMEDQVSVISFNAQQLERLHEKMPGMSIGYLNGGMMDDANLYPSIREVLQTTQTIGSTFNPSYAGLTKRYAEAANHRGITFWPWTYRSKPVYDEQFTWGIHGLTTDDAHWSSDWLERLDASRDRVNGKVNRPIRIEAKGTTYDRNVVDVDVEVVPIYANDPLVVKGNEVTATKPGTYDVLLRHTYVPQEGPAYTLYSEPVEVKVTKGSSGGGGGGGNSSSEPEQPDLPTVPSPPTDEPLTHSFEDIVGSFAESSIAKLTNRSIFYGKTDRLFAPNDTMTRAEFTAVVTRALDLPKTDVKGTFRDVAIHRTWAVEAIEAATKAGIVYGKTAERFEPDVPMTRAEMTVLMMRAYDHLNGENRARTPLTYNDRGSIGRFAIEAVERATALGIVHGTNGSFLPERHATRAEAAVMLDRLLQKGEKER